MERLLKKGFEVLYLTEPVDEYCIQAMPEFEGKKFQNVAKEGLKLDDGEKSKEAFQQLEEQVRGLNNPCLSFKKSQATHFSTSR